MLLVSQPQGLASQLLLLVSQLQDLASQSVLLISQPQGLVTHPMLTVSQPHLVRVSQVISIVIFVVPFGRQMPVLASHLVSQLLLLVSQSVLSASQHQCLASQCQRLVSQPTLMVSLVAPLSVLRVTPFYSLMSTASRIR
jgi:hypothetical protein